ncbi:glycosyltransferase [uncultured Enterovirga sp.]|uniref:glycosyltransferase n=1 Tax=uncultured Enterovirga sp. TaxID=2026352 RepID=UPI0035C9BEFA
MARAVAETGLLDEEWYLWRYPDVRGFPGGVVAHFAKHGFSELRQPSPHVNPAKFLHKHPRLEREDLRLAFLVMARLDPAERDKDWQADDDESLEYLLARTDLFDEAWYVRVNRDVGVSGMKAIQHFVRHGAAELRDPGPAFDSNFYQLLYPDYLERSRSPLADYIRFGRSRGYLARGPSGYQRWIDAFDQLSDEDVRRIRQDGAHLTTSVVAVHVLDLETAPAIDRMLNAWDGQIGADVTVRFVRGAGIPADVWVTCVARVAGQARARCVEPSEALADCAAGTVVLLCGGATLVRPHCAYALAGTLARRSADAAYADHDHVDEAGTRTRPVFKPAMSPEFMRRLPYAGPMIAALIGDPMREHIAAAVAQAASGEPDRAFASYLLTLDPGRVARVPFLLFGRPETRSERIEVLYEPAPASRLPPDIVTTQGADLPGVTVIIPIRDRVELLRNCVVSIVEATDYPAERIELLIVDNGSTESDTARYLADLQRRPGTTIVPSPGPFNFAAICNDGAEKARGEILVFLNNDTTVNRRDWLAKLVHHARRPEVGLVGAQLLYPDGIVQHGGVVLGVQGVGAHRLSNVVGDHAAEIDVTREMTCVTGACLAVKRSVFAALGGFDTVLKVAFNDVKLCAAAFTAGYTNIYVGEPLLIHHESKSRGFDTTRAQQHRNSREAIYVREQFGPLFLDDRSYSPNLSLQAVGALGTPPRVVRPWRRSLPGLARVLLLSRVHGQGNGVATVLDQQAAFLLGRGWDVTVGGPVGKNDLAYDGCRRANLWTAESAAAYAVQAGIDCIVAHTPPFFSVTRYLGAWPLVYFFDHGEPPPRFFPDRNAREDVDWEKRFAAPLAHRVFAISQAINARQYHRNVVVVRNGNSHLATWSDPWEERRVAVRKALGYEDKFLVLNVCRFGEGERFYKGINRYGEVASDLPFRHPDLAATVVFLIAGRGDDDDVAEMRDLGLVPFANVSDAEMRDLYAASDLYVNLSEWEGYNLGIGQAMAMGLDVVASDIDAHREFGVDVSNTIPEICDRIATRVKRWSPGSSARRPVVEHWEEPLARFADILEQDHDAQVGDRWF